MGERRDRLIAALAALPPAPALDLVCRGAVELLDVGACAVILMSESEAGSVAAAHGPDIGVVEDLQFGLGEGPCLTAYRTGAAVLEPDIAGAAQRWPAFAPAAAAAGVCAVFALPLQIGAIRFGVLYLLRATSGRLPDEMLADAVGLAQLATLAVLDHQQDGADLTEGRVATTGWANRAVVHQATGMVSAQLGIGLADALARLRARAYAAERPLYDVAVDVVDRRIRFTAEPQQGATP